MKIVDIPFLFCYSKGGTLAGLKKRFTLAAKSIKI